MAQNVGKRFEQCWKESCPNYTLLIRLNDSPQAFKQSNLTRFTPNSPFDFLMFDTVKQKLLCLELKTTSSKSISFEDVDNDEKQSKMLHKHQILGLTKYADYPNVIAGIISNFRDEKNNEQRTYFQNINDFHIMRKANSKFSYNEKDILIYGGIEIFGAKKRVNYTWDIGEFLEKLYNK